MLSNILTELPWAFISAIALFVTWYYPAGFFRNAQLTDTVHQRGGLMFLFVLMYMLFTSTFGYMCVTCFELAETAGNTANLLFILCLIFCGLVFPFSWFMQYGANDKCTGPTWLVPPILDIHVSGFSFHIYCRGNDSNGSSYVANRLLSKRTGHLRTSLIADMR